MRTRRDKRNRTQLTTTRDLKPPTSVFRAASRSPLIALAYLLPARRRKPKSEKRERRNLIRVLSRAYVVSFSPHFLTTSRYDRARARFKITTAVELLLGKLHARAFAARLSVRDVFSCLSAVIFQREGSRVFSSFSTPCLLSKHSLPL